MRLMFSGLPIFHRSEVPPFAPPFFVGEPTSILQFTYNPFAVVQLLVNAYQYSTMREP